MDSYAFFIKIIVIMDYLSEVRFLIVTYLPWFRNFFLKIDFYFKEHSC